MGICGARGGDEVRGVDLGVFCYGLGEEVREDPAPVVPDGVILWVEFQEAGR